VQKLIKVKQEITFRFITTMQAYTNTSRKESGQRSCLVENKQTKRFIYLLLIIIIYYIFLIIYYYNFITNK